MRHLLSLTDELMTLRVSDPCFGKVDSLSKKNNTHIETQPSGLRKVHHRTKLMVRLTYLQSPQRSSQVPLTRLHMASSGGGVTKTPTKLRVQMSRWSRMAFMVKQGGTMQPFVLRPPVSSPQPRQGWFASLACLLACVRRQTSSRRTTWRVRQWQAVLLLVA